MSDWYEFPEGDPPESGKQVLCHSEDFGFWIDVWDEQYESPCSFSSVAVPVGFDWDSGMTPERWTEIPNLPSFAVK